MTAGVLYYSFGITDNTTVWVESINVKYGDVTTLVTATGTIEPIIQVDVGTQVSGTINKIYVDFNSVVKQGQLIAELDKTNLNMAVTKAQVQYDNAVNDKDYMETIYDRQNIMYEKQLVSETELEQALYNLTNAKNTEASKLYDLEEANTNLGYADIYSPINGVVLFKDVDEGQTVAASFSTPTLFTIAQDLHEMQVEADVDEADIGQISEGQRATFTVDAFPNENFSGVVMQIRLNPTVTSNVVTYTVVIKADNPEMKLKPGLTATISIYTLELKNVLTLQSKALNFQPDNELLAKYNAKQQMVEKIESKGSKPNSGEESNRTMVWILRDNLITTSSVETGVSDGVQVQILTGLKEGDEIVFSLKEIAEATIEESENSSPFMPKRPGSKK
ncbi:MAG: efflux RND transporter periplasmic adaptor subunit [Ignavibacteria bacterium]